MGTSNTFWMFCPKCGWQADEPNTAMKPVCPECKADMHITSPDVGEESAFLKQVAEKGARQMCIDNGVLDKHGLSLQRQARLA